MSQKTQVSTTIVIIMLTTTIFFGVFAHEYRSLQNYMGYIAEHGKSALFHEEYINQNLAFQLSRRFSSPPAVLLNDTGEEIDICQHVESVNGIFGLNLIDKTFPTLEGTLQTRNPSCANWATDVPSLVIFQGNLTETSSKYSFSNYTGYAFNNIRYYIDLLNNYIYINRLVDSRHYIFSNWLVSRNDRIDVENSTHTFNIDTTALNDLYHGNSIVSHIYRDGYTKRNIISMLTPVFQHDAIKGIIITDINIRDLATSFYTKERPLLWRFLSLYVTDNTTGDIIVFNQPELRTIALINHQEDLTLNYTLNIKLDGIYLLINTLWLIALYLISTWLLCRYARRQLDRHIALSRDNITDAMTGLYNRKILTPALEQKIQTLLQKNIDITVIAIDSDGLKKINDTLGHHIGDMVIQHLGTALTRSIRKSDYGIRLGGDEFNLILIDYTLAKSHNVIARIQSNLAILDKDNLVSFSYGSYQLLPNDSLAVALLKADELLYQHKRNK